MSRTVTTSLNIAYGKGSTYLTATNISFDVSVLGVDMTFRLYLNGSTRGYATLNSTAMGILYPTATAKPYRLDHSFEAGQGITSSASYIYLQFGGTNVQQATSLPLLSASTYTLTGSTVSAVTNSTRSTIIRYAVYSSSTVNAVAGRNCTFTLYFYQYDCAAQRISNGLSSVSVSNATPYYNDPVTYTAVVRSGATWQGWYSDVNHTNLVSTNQSYTTTPNKDLTLYGYAGTLASEHFVNVDGIWKTIDSKYVNINGVWKTADAVYGNVDGVWKST